MAKRKEPENVVDEGSEQSRRNFITKMVTTAGAVAAAGLVAGAVEAGKIDMGKVEIHKNVTQIKWGKVRNGFRLSLSGSELGTALRGAGLLAENANLDKAMMTIEFTA